MKKFKVKVNDAVYVVKAENDASAVRKLKHSLFDKSSNSIRDAKQRIDYNEFKRIQKEANALFSFNRNANIVFDDDFSCYDEDTNTTCIGSFHIQTSGTWLTSINDAERYVKELKECIDFMKKYRKYL